MSDTTLKAGGRFLELDGYAITSHGMRWKNWPRIAAEGPPDVDQVAPLRRRVRRRVPTGRSGRSSTQCVVRAGSGPPHPKRERQNLRA